MKKFCSLLLFYAILFKANSQPGRLDSSFGNNGVQTASFFNNVNSLTEEGRVILPSASGNVFVVVQITGSYDSTRIVRYLPDGRLDSSYGTTGYSSVVQLTANGAAFQGDKMIVAGSVTTGNIVTGYSAFALVRYTADGTLDSSFGVNGIVSTDFDGSGEASYDFATSIMLQGNKILVAGSALNSDGYDFVLARYTADGKLDSSFGENGKVTTDFNNSDDAVTSMVLQGDKIVVAGRAYTNGSNTDFALARYTADGTLDSSFGVNGKVSTDFDGNDDYASSLLLQGDKIIIGGSTNYYIEQIGFNSDIALARFTKNGKLDSSFGVNGKVTNDFTQDDHATSIALQEDKIVVGGSSGDYPNEDFTLVRYTANGTLDASFGVNGKVTTDFNNSNDRVNSIALQENKIIAAGYKIEDYALARYTADGTLDPFFGKNGLLTGYFPTSQAFFTSVAMQGNKLVAAGITNDSTNTDFAIARYTTAGVPDVSFGVNGIVTTDFNNSNDYAISVALQGDRIILAGSTHNAVNNNDDFALARYTKDGKLDSSFGVNGKIITDFGYDDRATSIALQGDKIVVAGFDYDAVSEKVAIALARYTVNGTLDASFGVNGKITTHFNNDADFGPYNHAYVYSLALQGDKIVVSGYIPTFEGQDEDFALARYTKDGALDSSFGVNGIVTTDFGGEFDNATSIALQGDKIVVGGATGEIDFGSVFALARYLANGTLDSSFGKNGKVNTPINGAGNRATSIALQGDKIILAGYAGDYNGDWLSDFALARYTDSGTLDSSFGENGIVTTDLKEGDILQAVIVHQNKLYAVGGIGKLDYTRGIPYFSRGTSYGAIAAYRLETPEPVISIADVTVSESKRLAIATVRLSAPAGKLVRLHFTTRDKTAVYNQDYLPISGPLLFIPGVNPTVKAIIPIVDDSQVEGDEQFEIVLSNARNAAIQDSVGVVTIVDNDDALITSQQSTSLRIQASPNPSANSFTVQLQGSNLKQPASIRVYDVSGRVLEQRSNISIGESLHLGNQYKTGTYIIEAVQGSKKVQTKVIKTDR